jgi:DUF1680 family protein
MFKLFLVSLAVLTALPAWAQDVTTSQRYLKAKPFDMKEVKLKKSIFTKYSEANIKYLHDFPVERLLYNFRANAKMKTRVQPLTGWESPDCELRGHFTGHFLSALSLAYSSTGDETMKLKADTLVRGLAEVQRKLGKSGYLSAFPESFFDRLERGEGVWAPYYTLHKILAGLLDAYCHLDNKQALDVAKRLGLWVYNRNKDIPYAKMQQILRTEFGGIGESLYILYDLTGDKRYHEAALKFHDDSLFKPLYHHQDSLTGLHSNTQMAKLVAQARAYEIDGDWRDRDMLDYVWHELVGQRSYATGGNSNYECFNSGPGVLADVTGPNDHENCVTYNMLKLTSHLFTWQPRAEYAEYYERALMNGVLGTTLRDVGGTAQYYVAQRPGSFRVYCRPDSDFVCCSGTGVESFAKFNDNIYFHDDTTIWVNQYIASTLNWEERGIGLDMETGYPRFDDVHFTLSLSHPERLALKFRIPAWAEKGVTVAINGKTLDVVGEPSSYLTLKRQWHDGDRVDLVIPREFHLWRFPDNPRRVAILYGPVVMAAGLGTEDMSASAQRGFGGTTGKEQHFGPVVDVPAIVSDSDNWLSAFKLHPGHRLTFEEHGITQPTDIVLTPFYDMCKQRYSLYFDVYTTKEWEDFCQKYRRFAAGVADSIVMSDHVSTYDHNLQPYKLTRGTSPQGGWVQAWQSLRFDMRLPQADKARKLILVFSGNDNGTSVKIDVNGSNLATTRMVRHEAPYEVAYDLPASMLQGKHRINIGLTAEDEQKHPTTTPQVISARIVEK